MVFPQKNRKNKKIRGKNKNERKTKLFVSKLEAKSVLSNVLKI